MFSLLQLIRMVAVLAAAIVIGNRFLEEVRRIKTAGKPWYKVYLTVPGAVMILAVLLPLVVWWFKTR